MPTDTAYVAVGANLDPERHILEAVRMLAGRVRLVAVSPFYYSEPLCRPEQPRFLNGVLAIETALPPRSLRDEILRPIEWALGRRRTADRHAARPIDLDILLYGTQQVVTEDLVIPDPEIAQRPFLAVPLLDLAPGMRIPGEERPLAELVHPGMREALEPAERFTRLLERELELDPGRKRWSHCDEHGEDR